jgi:hypothetical protein
MHTRKLRVGQSITPEEFDELDELDELDDEQLARLVPRAWREFFPGMMLDIAGGERPPREA